MSIPIPDRNRSIDALRDAVARFTAILREAPPGITAIGTWTVADLSAHARQLFEMYPRIVRGEASPVRDHLDMSGYWNGSLEADAGRDPSEAADRVEAASAAFIEGTTDSNWTEDVTWHGGIRIPVYALASVLLNEAEVHGYDLAAAMGRPWAIEREVAVMILEGHLPILPAYLNQATSADLDAIFALKLRGGPKVYFLVDHGTLAIRDDPPKRVDCRISADPLAYLLVGYGRTGQWSSILTGKITAYGRKPWLGLRFPKLFHSV